jgi:hypothetical protein
MRIRVLNSVLTCVLFFLSSMAVAQSEKDVGSGVILCFKEISQILKDLGKPPLSDSKWGFNRHGKNMTYAELMADPATRSNELEHRLPPLWKESEEFGKKIKELDAILEPSESSGIMSLEGAVLLADRSCSDAECDPATKAFINRHRPKLFAAKKIQDKRNDLALNKKVIDDKIDKITGKSFDLTIGLGLSASAIGDVTIGQKKDDEYLRKIWNLDSKLSDLKNKSTTAQKVSKTLRSQRGKTSGDLEDIAGLENALRKWKPEIEGLKKEIAELEKSRADNRKSLDKSTKQINGEGTVFFSYGNSEIIVSIEGDRFAMNLKKCNIGEVNHTVDPRTTYQSIADLCIKRQDRFCAPYVAGFCKDSRQMTGLDAEAKEKCKDIVSSSLYLKNEPAR